MCKFNKQIPFPLGTTRLNADLRQFIPPLMSIHCLWPVSHYGICPTEIHQGHASLISLTFPETAENLAKVMILNISHFSLATKHSKTNKTKISLT